jgi:hypothetical protein
VTAYATATPNDTLAMCPKKILLRKKAEETTKQKEESVVTSRSLFLRRYSYVDCVLRSNLQEFHQLYHYGISAVVYKQSWNLS